MSAEPAPALSRAELLGRLRVTLIGYVLWYAGYALVGNYACTLPSIDVSLPIDALIPFAPHGIWIYELTYVLPLAACFCIDDARRFDRALLAITLASLSAFVVYVVFPVAFPHPALGDGLAERMIALEYSYDFPPGANHLPSLHVCNAFILYAAARGKRLGSTGSHAALALAVAIAISTLLVKQHVVLDVVAGVLWALGAWKLAGPLGTFAHATRA